MTDEPLTIGELGGYTNNTINKEGLKKLVKKVNEGSQGVEYTAGANISISDENVISATDTKYTAGTGISISEENVISVNGSSFVVVPTADFNLSDFVDSNGVVLQDFIFEAHMNNNSPSINKTCISPLYSKGVRVYGFVIQAGNYITDVRVGDMYADNSYLIRCYCKAVYDSDDYLNISEVNGPSISKSNYDGESATLPNGKYKFYKRV